MGMLQKMREDMAALEAKRKADKETREAKHEARKEEISLEWQGAKSKFKRRRRMSVVDRLKDTVKTTE